MNADCTDKNFRNHISVYQRESAAKFQMNKIVESYKRKLVSEDGWVLKRGAQLRIALCYPNVYSIGMANLGFQAMYELFNNIPEVSCERVFLPDSARSVKVSEGSVSTRTLFNKRASNIEHSRKGSGYEVQAPRKLDS